MGVGNYHNIELLRCSGHSAIGESTSTINDLSTRQRSLKQSCVWVRSTGGSDLVGSNWVGLERLGLARSSHRFYYKDRCVRSGRVQFFCKYNLVLVVIRLNTAVRLGSKYSLTTGRTGSCPVFSASSVWSGREKLTDAKLCADVTDRVDRSAENDLTIEVFVYGLHRAENLPPVKDFHVRLFTSNRRYIIYPNPEYVETVCCRRGLDTGRKLTDIQSSNFPGRRCIF